MIGFVSRFNVISFHIASLFIGSVKINKACCKNNIQQVPCSEAQIPSKESTPNNSLYGLSYEHVTNKIIYKQVIHIIGRGKLSRL
jgi:hypothetical protein